jgi:translocation and assembly module TamB
MWLLSALAVVVVLAGAGVLGVRNYLASPRAAAQAARAVEKAYGGPVQVQRVEVGLHGSSLEGLKLYEPGAGTDQAPWAELRDVRTDVSAWGLAAGAAAPRHLDVTRADVTLHFDKDGHLLTRLPHRETPAAAFPEIHISQGRLTLIQEGRPDFVVDGIDMRVQAKDGRLALTGTVADPHWGDWTADGAVDPKAGSLSGTLKTTHEVHATQAMLEALPFISPGVWKQVQAEGDTTVELALGFNAGAPGVTYRVELNAEKTRVHVTAIDLDADQAHGKVIVENGVVRLEKVQGQTAEGAISTDAVMDFHVTPNQLTFSVNAQGLDLHQLPRKWNLPHQVEGRLTGQADLKVTVTDGKAHTTGDGYGEIDNARVVGLAAKPIHLKLHADGTGFHFLPQRPRSAQGKEDRPGLADLAVSLLAPTEPAAPPARPAPERAGPSAAQNLDRLGSGVIHAAGGVADTGVKLLRRVPRTVTARPKPPDQPPSYLDASLSLEDVDVVQLLRGLQLSLPFPVTGRLSIDIQLSVPIDTPQDTKAYRLKGSARAPWLDIAGVRLEQLRARVDYAGGVLHLENLQGQVPAGKEFGTFRGSARLEVIPQGNLTADLMLERILLARVLALVPNAAEKAGGDISGNATARVPVARLHEIKAWTASARITADRLLAYGLTLEDAAATVRLQEGVVSVSALDGKLAGAAVSGTAELHLGDAFHYQAKLGLKQADLGTIRRLVAEVRPPFPMEGSTDVTADVQGTLEPLTWRASGTAAGRELKLDAIKIDDLKLNWDGNCDRIELTEIRAAMYHGDVTGSAAVPLGAANAAASAPVRLQFKDLDVGGMTQDVLAVMIPRSTPAPEGARANPPLRLEGQASGTVEGRLTPADLDGQPGFSGQVDLRSQRLRVQGFLTERLQGTVGYRKGTVEYRLEGEALGGKFVLEGELPPRQPKPSGSSSQARRNTETVPARQPAAQPAEAPGHGRFHLEKAQLPRLWQDLGVQAALGPLHGSLDLDLAFTEPAGDQPATGSGQFRVTSLSWGTTDLGALGSDLRLRGDEVRVVDLRGRVGQGLLGGGLAVNLRQAERGWFNIILEGIEASRLLAPWPALASRVEGPVNISVRGTPGREWTGDGSVTLLRGKVLGVEVSEWRLPVDFDYSPRRGYGRLDVRDTNATVALGRVSGRAGLSWDGATRLDGSLRFSGLDLEALLRPLTDMGQVGTGKLSGRLDFGSKDLRSVDDLTATLDAQFQQARGLDYPVLRQLTPYLGRGQSSGTFRSGDARARLDRGVVRVQRLTLSGSTLQLLIEGTLTLAGRLDLDVTANTGVVGVNPPALRLLGLRIPALGPIPVSLLLEATTYFSNRLIHLRVTGTVRSPSVQVEPMSLLTEEAVRFFVNRANLPIP